MKLGEWDSHSNSKMNSEHEEKKSEALNESRGKGEQDGERVRNVREKR